MPIYDFSCFFCGQFHEDIFAKVAERNNQKCRNCGGTLDLKLGRSQPHHFKEGFYRNLTGPDTSIWFTSKRQLREECNKRGVVSDYLS